jgi:hypothetical protein
VVTAAAFADGELEGLLAEVLGSRSWTLAPPSPGGPADHPSDELGAGLPSLVVEGGDVRVRVSVAAAAEELLREKRAELATALLGEEAAND